MKATICRKTHNPTNLSLATKQTILLFSSSSGGHGRGRGGFPSGPSHFEFTPPQAPGQPQPEVPKAEHPDSSPPPGLGHGRGKPKPISSSPTPPSFSSFISSIKPLSAGRGRVIDMPSPTDQSSSKGPDTGPKKPTFFVKEKSIDSAAKIRAESLDSGEKETSQSSSFLSILSGAGRGKPMKQPGLEVEVKEENRHLRARQVRGGRGTGGPGRGTVVSQRMNREDAVKNAVQILSRSGVGNEDGSAVGGRGRGRGRGGFRGRGGRGRGRFRGRGTGERGRLQDEEEGEGAGLFLGDNADGEKLAKRIGPEHMNQLVEGFEELSGRVLPSPLDDEYLDALHTNYMIEFEPEYLMGEFDRNPDIDEKPPIPLRDALEKMKPFLMAYEGIQSQEEWEEIVNETMERVPLLKEIVDHYSGPDRVTAKQQQEELARVAKTVPNRAPDSVKQFTNRAVLSLQSNPGWGFDKKCQFMDKLVREVSQHYK